MILKMESKKGWVIANLSNCIEYGYPRSKEWGFYTNRMNKENPIDVVVYKSNLGKDVYYFTYSEAMLVTGPIEDRYRNSAKISIYGRGKLERDFFDLDETPDEFDVHEEEVIFTSWLRDIKTDNIYLFDLAYLLDDSGNTIECIR